MRVRSNEREAIQRGEITGEILQQQLDWLFDTRFTGGLGVSSEVHLIGDIDDQHTAIFQHLNLVNVQGTLPDQLPQQADITLDRRIRLNDNRTYGYNRYVVNGRGIRFRPDGKVQQVEEAIAEDRVLRAGPVLSDDETSELFTALDSPFLHTYQSLRFSLESRKRSMGQELGRRIGRSLGSKT